MRKSKRTEILDAAFRVIQRDGVTAVTYESIATETGLSKGGLLYHFPSREALLLALHEHRANQWEHDMITIAGKTADEATPDERLTAYIRASMQTTSRADLLLMLEAIDDPDMNAPWDNVLQRWAPPHPRTPTAPAEVESFIARLAADGLWLYEAVSDTPLEPELRQQIVERIIAAARPAGGSPGPPRRPTPRCE